MPKETRLEELLDEWDERRERGEAVTPEDLCADCLELLPELKRQIAALASVEAVLKTTIRPGSIESEASFLGSRGPTGFSGTERYELIRQLGAGGMGVVYEVFDRERNQRLALKFLPRTDGDALYRFKREFRILVDLSHPNLVTLHELRSEGNQWWYTMELVDGVDFLTHVDGGRAGGLTGERLGRLRDGLRQLAEGVAALHAVGSIHCDIKPSNVLVTGAGRVVIVDLGIAQIYDRPAYMWTTEAGFAGTPGYMAPEQALGAPVCGSDWYAFGVLLYQSLTGVLPFSGTPTRMLLAKERSDFRPPQELEANVPDDLNQLCLELLQCDLEKRAGYESILACLGPRQLPSSSAPASCARGAHKGVFVGRRRQLASLHEALARVEGGTPQFVLLEGLSGVGKSALMEEFLRQIHVRDEIVILTGRCYEQESLAFKAFDGILDALCGLLRSLPEPEAGALLPRHIAALARVFPVLRRIRLVAALADRASVPPDQQELRRRSFDVLRDLLGGLSDRWTVVLAIDDLQWADLESALLFNHLRRFPDAPPLLIVGNYRSDNRDENICLQKLLQQEPNDNRLVPPTVIPVAPLQESEAYELVQALGGSSAPLSDDRVAEIVRDAAGSPLFVRELLEFTASDQPVFGGSLDELIWARVCRLPTPEAELLKHIAVAGRPVTQRLLRDALMAERDHVAFEVLRSARLIKTTGTAFHDKVEPYHDRIRESVASHLTSAEKRRIHERWAESLAEAEPADPEMRALHLQECGRDQESADMYVLAGEQATQQLAFDHAAELFRRALLLEERSRCRLPETLRVRLADTLADAGRGTEAAAEYLRAAEAAAELDAVELRRRAAMQLLTSGHVDQGVEELQEVLRDLQLPLPKSPARAAVGLLWRRGQLRLSGLAAPWRPELEIDRRQLLCIDACWAAAAGLSIVDTIQGAYFQTLGLLLALRAAEPSRSARYLAWQSMHYSCNGSRAPQAYLARLLNAAAVAAAHSSSPLVQVDRFLVPAMNACLTGQWKKAIDWCEQAEDFIRRECSQAAWELNTAHSFHLWALYYRGTIAELRSRLTALCDDARNRGNIYALINHSSFGRYLVRLADDCPADAMSELNQLADIWTTQRYTVQHVNMDGGHVLCRLYAGDYRAASRLAQRQLSRLRASQLFRIQVLRVFTLNMCAATSLSVALAEGTKSDLRMAERYCRQLHREGVRWSRALSVLVAAGIARIKGDIDAAQRHLEQAAEEFRQVDMQLHAAVATRSRGRLIGGDEGARLIDECETWMRDQTIKNPSRMAALIAPAFAGSA